MSYNSTKVEIVKIISEHSRKYHGENKVRPGCKRVEAIIKGRSGNETRHVDTEDGKIGYQKIKVYLPCNEKSYESRNKKGVFNKRSRSDSAKGTNKSFRPKKYIGKDGARNGKRVDRNYNRSK